MRLVDTSCRIAHPISRPHPAQNLISLYGLDRIVRTVIRRDPVTGEKINKLRKSYEGKVKELGLAGKNKASEAKGDMLNILAVPDEEWRNQQVFGKEIPQALPSDLLAKLDRAVQMAPGKLRTDAENRWRGVIAADDTTKPKPGPEVAIKKPMQNAIAQAQLPGRPSAAPSPALKPMRPERTGTKRRYNDASFKGYGEGYADDDIADSTAGEDDGRGNALKKKRRKVAIAV